VRDCVHACMRAYMDDEWCVHAYGGGFFFVMRVFRLLVFFPVGPVRRSFLLSLPFLLCVALLHDHFGCDHVTVLGNVWSFSRTLVSDCLFSDP
jgi:hypothetical protein